MTSSVPISHVIRRWGIQRITIVVLLLALSLFLVYLQVWHTPFFSSGMSVEPGGWESFGSSG